MTLILESITPNTANHTMDVKWRDDETNMPHRRIYDYREKNRFIADVGAASADYLAVYDTFIEWGNANYVAPPPLTTEQLVNEVKAEAQRIIYSKWPLWAQQNCNDGTYSPADKEQMIADKALILSECTRLVIAIEAGQATIPNWPTI